MTLSPLTTLVCIGSWLAGGLGIIIILLLGLRYVDRDPLDAESTTRDGRRPRNDARGMNDRT